MLYFGKKSISNLSMLTPDLQRVARKALETEVMDFAIVCSFRGEFDQNHLFQEEKSRVEWPNSKHNKWPAKAMDLAPWVKGKLSWNKFHCCVLAGVVLAVAKMEGAELRWGGNWDMDDEPVTDQDFQDLVHFEECPKIGQGR